MAALGEASFSTVEIEASLATALTQALSCRRELQSPFGGGGGRLFDVGKAEDPILAVVMDASRPSAEMDGSLSM